MISSSLLAAFALGAVVKATILLGIAGVLATVLLRASAAVRHLVWLLALGSAITIIGLAPLAPSIGVSVPAAVALSSLGDAPPSGTSDSFTAEVASANGLTVTAVTNLASDRGSVARDVVARVGMPSLPFAFAIAWVIGCSIVLARCVRAHRAVARFVAASEPVTGTIWRRIIDDAAGRMHVRRRVAVVLSDAVGGPVTSGVLRPVILLPSDADTWTEERGRVVLLHEMAHIARHDYVAQLVATTACALYWFNPAVWMAAARMRLEAEHAADDRVLSTGLTGDRYATHLVDLARRAAIGEPAAVAVAIAHRTHIERRVRAMLDTTRSRRHVSSRAQWFAVVLTVIALVPVAGMRANAAAEVTAADVVVAGPSIVRVTTPVSGVTASPAAQASDSVFERTISAKSGGALTLNLDTGGGVTIHGWDEPRARVRVTLSGRDWRDTRVSFEPVGGDIELRSEFDRPRNTRQTSHEFELWIPRKSDVRIESAGGQLTIENVDGQFTGHTGGGEISIHDAKGRSSLSTGGGDIVVSRSDLSGSVSTGGGAVTLSSVSGGLRGSSGSGPVIYGERRSSGFGRSGSDTTADLTGLTVSSSGSRSVTITGSGTSMTTTTNRTRPSVRSSDLGALFISKAGGSIRLDDIPDGGSVRTGGGDITIQRSGGHLQATTGGGDIELRRVTGSANASTGSGDVTITVVDENGAEHNIEASSGHGTIELILPRSIDARIELETAYTEGSGKTRIESDWTLERSESRDWETQYGTPRKFVRGKAVSGNGRGLIRVSAVNGDVIVRRAN